MLRHITILMGVLAFLGLSAPDASALVYNVMSYGAAGDGSIDDGTEIQNAINAAAAAGGGEVYFPAGKYKLAQTLSISTSVTLRGEGQRTSVLIFRGLPNGNHGVYFFSSGSAVHQTLTVRGLSLLRDDGAGGAAIVGGWPQLVTPPALITYTTGGGVTSLIEDVHIGTGHWPGGSEYWDYGIILLNAKAAKIATFNIQGPGSSSGVAGVYVGGTGVQPVRTVGAAIHDGTVTGFLRGIYVYDQSEVVNLQQIVIKNVTTGIELVNAGRGTSVTNNQIWTKVYGVRSYNSLGELAITSNRIYRETDTSFVGIEINNESVQTARCRLIGNYIWSASAAGVGHTGILLANNVMDTIINGNTTVNMTSGIVLANSPVTRTLVHGNQNRNAGTPISWAFSTSPSLVNNW
jgi:hypothetical protein